MINCEELIKSVYSGTSAMRKHGNACITKRKRSGDQNILPFEFANRCAKMRDRDQKAVLLYEDGASINCGEFPYCGVFANPPELF